MDHSQLWNKYMKCYDFLNGLESYSHNISDVAVHAEAHTGSKILDAGSGTGNLSILLSNRGAVVTSCDFSPTALAVHAKKDPSAKLVHASLENQLPFEDDSFDGVCCASVLFALTQPGCINAVNEFHRVVRPGGKVVITAGTRAASLSRLVKMYLATLKQYSPTTVACRCVVDFPKLLRILYYNFALRRIPDWQGFHLFTTAELETLLTRAGFSSISIRSTYGGCFLLAEGWKPTVAQTSDVINRIAA